MTNTSRRNVLGAAAGAAAAASFLHLPEAEAAGASPILLVHGAWHGGWCWRDVIPTLTAQGYRVYAPSLTGLGDRAHLASRDIDLTTHINDIVNIIKFEELENVTLVGHSYGGVVISGVADRVKDKLKTLVYLDAVLTENGAAMTTEEAMYERDPAIEETGFLPVYDMDFLGVPLDMEGKVAWLERHLRPHPARTLTESIQYTNGGFSGLPKVFVRCVNERTEARGEVLQSFFDTAPEEWTYVTLDTGHDLMVTAPLETADIILDAAKA